MGLKTLIFPPAAALENFPLQAELPARALPFIWHFVGQLKAPLIVMTVLYAFGMIVFALEPYLIGRLVDALANAAPDHVWPSVGGIIAFYFIVVQIGGRIGYNTGHLVESYALPLLKMIVRRQLAASLSRHSYRYFSSDFAGRLAGKVIEMPAAVSAVVGDICFPLQFALLNTLMSLALFAAIDPWLCLPVGLYILANVLAYRWLIPKISQKAERAAAEQQTMRGLYLDSISNILLIKLFGAEARESRLFSQAQIKAGTAEQAEQRQFTTCWRVQNIINGLFQLGVLLLAISLYRTSTITIGQFATAMALALTLASNVWMTLQTLTQFFSRFATINEALGTLLQPHEVHDATVTQPLQMRDSSLALQDVSFSYPGRNVFRNLTLNIPPGQKVGLIGPSGAGKSTLMQLLLRLYDVQQGRVLVGGQDVRAVAQSDLRRAIAVIPQATDLMHRSIFDNIAYGSPEATMEQVVQAAKQAHIHETIASLRDEDGNNGYAAMVGERGVRLSGGQRQRVAIARAFLKNAPILILDEPTSALDSESERLIQQSLIPLMQGRTTIVIAHRLSTISHLDRIIVLENGTISADGPHDGLLADNGLYARLWALQSEGFLGDLI